MKLKLAYFVTFLIMANFAWAQQKIDWQGHRGCRGLSPENTITAFLEALEYPQISTLELDVVVSADEQIVVSHEAWMNAEIMTSPDGKPLTEELGKSYNLYKMRYDEIKKFDCGKRGHPRFKEQKAKAEYKPLLSEVVEEVKKYCEKHNRPFPNFNIELKTEGEEKDGIYQPSPEQFVNLVLNQITNLGLEEHCNLQSFDFRIVKEIRRQNSNIPIAVLVGDDNIPFEKLFEILDFMPQIYSPYYEMVTKELVKACHSKDVKIIPWTVNETKAMSSLLEIGVDGIITDYPNRIPLDMSK